MDDFDFDAQTTKKTLKRLAGDAGRKIMTQGLTAFYVATDPRTPAWAQATLVSALVYLGMPLDAIPDVVPVVGFTDDAAVLVAALAAVATCVHPRHARKARRTLSAWRM